MCALCAFLVVSVGALQVAPEFTDAMVQEGLVRARARIQHKNAALGDGDPPEAAPPATLPAAAPPPPPDGLESAALI